MRFGEQVKKNRQDRGLSQIELAEMLGVSNKTVSGWEVGQKMPDMDTIAQISLVFDVSLEELFEDNIKRAKNILSNRKQSK